MKASLKSGRIVIRHIERGRNIGADRSNKRRIGLFLSSLMGMARPGFISQSPVLKSIPRVAIPSLFESPVRSASLGYPRAACFIPTHLQPYLYIYIFIRFPLTTCARVYMYFGAPTCSSSRYPSVCAIRWNHLSERLRY